MVMGRFGFGASAVLAMCLLGGYAKAGSQNSVSQESQEAPQKHAENLQELSTASRSLVTSPNWAEDQNVGSASSTDESEQSQQQTSHTPDPVWFYGAFIDAAYLLDFNRPANDLFRSRGTTYKLDYPLVNMAGAYIRKTPSESSRWVWS